MADDLSLLFKIRGDAAGAKQATAETRAAIVSLRSQMGSEFNQIQNAASSAFSNIGNNLNVFVGQRLPLVGGAFIRVTENVRNLGQESTKGEAALAKLGTTIDGIANATGKSGSQITSFLTSFVQLETQAKRDAAAIETFGASAAQKLIPELEKAGTEMSQVAVEAEGMGSGLAAAAGPIGIAVLALAALTAGAVLLSKEFIDLVVSTADWQGKMEDLSQQLGVSTELLSGLEILSKTTGGSIEQLAASLGIFQKNLEESQDPASKQAALMKELGIEATSTEDAFRQAVKALADMDEGYHQTATALELFGRGGKSVLAIIKETNGDLDGAIEKFREMGLVVDSEAAKAADAFNDQLAILGFQARATTGIIAQESIPQILAAVQEVSKVLAENRQAISVLGSAIALFAEGNIRGILVPALNLLRDVLSSVQFAFAGMEYAALRAAGASHEAAAQIANARREARSEGPALPGAFAGVSGVSMIQGLTGGAEALTVEKTKREAQAKLSEGQRLLNSLMSEYERLQAKANDLSKSEVIQAELKKKIYDSTNPTLKQQIQLYADLITTLEKTADVKKKIEEEEKKAEKERQEALQAADKLDNDRRALEDRIADALQNQREQLQKLQGFEKTHLQTVEEYIASVVKEAAAVDGVTDKMREYFKLLIQVAAKEDELEEKKKLFKGVEGDVEGIKPAKQLNPLVEGLRGQLLPALRKGEDGLLHFQGVASTALNAVGVAVNGLAQGFGNLLEQWVLTGEIGPNAVRKMVASVLAGLAAQAAVESLMELARGFAALADPFTAWEAPLHFHSAAIFGAVAGVAAIAGRGIAGSSFANQGGGGSAGSGGGAGGGSAAPGRSVSTVKEEWVQRQPHVFIFRVESNSAHVIDVVHDEFDLNGRTARFIIERVKKSS